MEDIVFRIPTHISSNHAYLLYNWMVFRYRNWFLLSFCITELQFFLIMLRQKVWPIYLWPQVYFPLTLHTCFTQSKGMENLVMMLTKWQFLNVCFNLMVYGEQELSLNFKELRLCFNLITDIFTTFFIFIQCSCISN